MSIKAMSTVWDQSPRKGSALLLLLAIADFANEEGAAWPSVDTLAQKCRMSRRNVQTLAAEMAKDGDITIDPNAGPSGTNIYRLSNVGGAKSAGAGVQTSGAKSARGGADQRPPVAHNPSGTTNQPSGTKAAGAARSPDHQNLIDQWHECYQMQFGTPYVMHAGADSKAVKQLLAATKLTAGEIMRVVTAAWSKKGKEFWVCENKTRTLRDVAANWNRMLAEIDRLMPGQVPQAGQVLERLTSQAPPGLKPELSRPTPGFNEAGEKISMEEYERLYPLKNYYDERTFKPLA